ncbi:MAG: bifunctional UDP-sugar hydrolase/5'-nucleotidase [Vicinamibacterales bacterium]
MTRRWLPSLVAPVCLVVCLVAASPAAAQFEEPSSPRLQSTLTVLQINDVYSTVPVDGVGGVARVATVKKELQAAGRSPLLMIGGDFLASSVASSVFKGEQMIAAFNAMGLDVATLGNHEFDFGVDLLLTRMTQAKWQWVIANVIDRKTNAIIGDAPPFVIRDINGLKVGIIGLCLLDEGMNNPELKTRLSLLDPLDTAARYVPEMKRQGAEVVIALTHLRIWADQALAERVPDIDLIVGGHEHYPINVTTGRTLITKAGMDARNIARIDIVKRPGGLIDRYYELIPVTSAVKDDPATLAVVTDWESRLSAEMDRPVGSTSVPLDAINQRVRSEETNLANLVADAMRQGAGAEVALMNTGGIRGNRVYPAGPLKRRDLVSIHPFGNVICTVELTGEALLRMLNIGVGNLPAVTSGQFPAVSGMTFRVTVANAPGDRVRDLRVNGTPVDLARIYTLAVPNYVLNGGDSYEAMKSSLRVLVDPEQGPLIVTALERYIDGREVSPTVDGRIAIEK